MNAHKPLLDALRIDRGTPPPARRRLPLWALLAVVLLPGAGAGAWYLRPEAAVTVHAVTADARADAAAGGDLDATGYVVARHMATLAPKFLGKLVTLNVEEGQHVSAGEVVARLDDTNFTAALKQAEAMQHQARTAFDDAAPIFARYQRLHEQGAISTDAFENQRTLYDGAREAVDVAEANVGVAQTNLTDTVIRAPYAGVITNKAAQVGEIVAPGGSSGSKTGIATIVDMDTLEVEVDVSENYIDRVRAGGAATIVLDAYSDWEIPAAVIAIIPTADRSKGTVKVRVAILQKDPRILPDMGARVTFATAPAAGRPPPRGVTVPRDAVEDHGRSGIVFVINGDNRLERREVSLGARLPQTVVLLAGVAAGERLVTGDLTALHDGARVRIEE